MAIPACLWRRTGEIYKANREFAELVGVDGYMLRDVRDLPSGRVTPLSVVECSYTDLFHCREGYVSTNSWPRTQL